jgi:RNA polymerase sigma-70 factor, ECF subfamily
MALSDSDLCALLAYDLSHYFDQMVLRFQIRLFAFALHLTGSRPNAEDILQDAFMGAYISLENYTPERIRTLQLQPWLYRIVLHTYQHYQRGSQVHLVPLGADEDASEIEIVDTVMLSPEQFIEQLEQQQEIQAALAVLPDRYRIPVTCYYFAHLSYQEIADLLDQPLGTVKSAIHRGLRQLRTLLSTQERGDVSWNPSTPRAQNQ